MLRKLYIVPDHRYRRGRSRPTPRERKKKRTKHHPLQAWVKLRHKIREADIRQKTRTEAISDFLRRVMPDMELPSTEPELSKK